ncbi:HPr family phosphocarrier protein [Alicyclobacillus dauci]|uniref:HPr family phosphocarrier protein n=1 Tax=Alicyclobacillus dauci TaxID=1475485 RepID=A0ABY6Z6T8_9BACL|nr:HPr family phosphocarrier protein [Alicyclobacillus dauci]WAH38398.1 HPr family phosphocarrier protein [Alicyclobacillus dauci]
MIERSVKIELAQGLAARPAAEFVKRAASFTSSVHIGKNGQFIDAKSILGVMSMAFSRGEELILQVDGADETAAVESLVELLSKEGL